MYNSNKKPVFFSVPGFTRSRRVICQSHVTNARGKLYSRDQITLEKITL